MLQAPLLRGAGACCVGLQWRHHDDDDDDMQETSEHAFEELFAAAYVVLDQIWFDTQAWYVQFPQVLRCVVVS